MTNIAKEERRFWIGGSEVAGLFNKSPYQTYYELWHVKAGNIPDSYEGNERIDAGLHLEKGIAAWGQDKFGLHLRNVDRYIKHPTIPRFGVSLDFETVKGHIPYEVKNVDGLVFRDQWTAEYSTELDPDDIPMHILLQCQAQLACTGKDHHGLLVLVSGNRLMHTVIERNDAAIAKIESTIIEFWKSVDSGIAPKPDFAKDAATIAALNLRSTPDVTVDFSHDNRLAYLCAEYMEAGAAEKEAKQRKSTARAEITQKIGDAEKAILEGFSISAKTQDEREVPASTRKASRPIRIYQKTITKAKEEKAA